MRILMLHMLLATFACAAAKIDVPAVKDSRWTLSLFAAEPEIVTPVGIAVDGRGQIFVVESHTHFPKKDYPGPKHDVIKVFQSDGTWKVYAEGFRAAMNLAFGPKGKLYLVHRNGVVILEGSDSRKEIVSLITKGNYPHNGLGGIAFSKDGWLYLGMGENLGEKYTLKGSDGSSYSGGGEGGNVFRCRPDGTKLEFVATGFWNAFALEFNDAGHLFCVDNDPDSRPPCRLIDVVMGGDYGYKFRYGRSGLHPYNAWNGEIPGTLPMVAGTGEAPSGILNRGDALLVTSWGDHAIELYRPKPWGASLRAEREVLVQGDKWFRPVGIAAAPDRNIYITDWVDVDYSVHRKGRIWRLRNQSNNRTADASPRPTAERQRMLKLLKKSSPGDLEDTDPFIRSAAVYSLSRERAHELLDAPSPAQRLGGMLALRRIGEKLSADRFTKMLSDSDEGIRHLTLIWIGEQKLAELAPALPKVLERKPMSTALFRAYNKTREVLGATGSGSKTTVIDLQTSPEEPPPFAIDPAAPKVDKAKLPTGPGDVEMGRKVFFHPVVGCARCHRIEDHGGSIGPDLSTIARASNREKLAQSIVDPSREIAPQFAQHVVETIDGETWSGLLENESKDGSVILTTAEGKGVFLPDTKIKSRSISKVSLMPEGLEQALTPQHWRDLIEFLASRK